VLVRAHKGTESGRGREGRGGGGVRRVCARAHWYSDSWHLSWCVDDTHVFVNDTCVCVYANIRMCVCNETRVCVCRPPTRMRVCMARACAFMQASSAALSAIPRMRAGGKGGGHMGGERKKRKKREQFLLILYSTINLFIEFRLT
jgi:hypothetical protein